MPIEFDPRTRNGHHAAQTGASPESPAGAQTGPLDRFDPFSPEQAAVSQLDILFSGIPNTRRLREEHPFELPHFPDLQREVLGRTPAIADSAASLTNVINRYRSIRVSLIERRRNYAHALEGYLQPAEALDLYSRIDAIDTALIEIEQEIQKANHLRRGLEERDRE